METSRHELIKYLFFSLKRRDCWGRRKNKRSGRGASPIFLKFFYRLNVAQQSFKIKKETFLERQRDSRPLTSIPGADYCEFVIRKSRNFARDPHALLFIISLDVCVGIPKNGSHFMIFWKFYIPSPKKV